MAGAAQLLGASGQAASGAAALIPALFGSGGRGSSSASGTSTTTGTTTEKLVLDQAAIDKIVKDVLGGEEGLAQIFSQEQAAGIFDSSVAAQAAGNLVTNLVGELAKLTAERQVEQEQKTVQESREKTKQKSGGLLGKITSIF